MSNKEEVTYILKEVLSGEDYDRGVIETCETSIHKITELLVNLTCLLIEKDILNLKDIDIVFSDSVYLSDYQNHNEKVKSYVKQQQKKENGDI